VATKGQGAAQEAHRSRGIMVPGVLAAGHGFAASNAEAGNDAASGDFVCLGTVRCVWNSNNGPVLTDGTATPAQVRCPAGSTSDSSPRPARIQRHVRTARADGPRTGRAKAGYHAAGAPHAWGIGLLNANAGGYPAAWRPAQERAHEEGHGGRSWQRRHLHRVSGRRTTRRGIPRRREFISRS